MVTISSYVCLEITLLLTLFHRGFGDLVVHPRRAALRDFGHGRFGDDLLDIVRIAFDRARAADVADRTETHLRGFAGFAFAHRRERRNRHEQTVAAHDLALMRVI